MNYAYRDQSGILHCVQEVHTARRYAQKEIIPTQIDCRDGFPVWQGRKIVDYGQGKIFYNNCSLEESTAHIAEKVRHILAQLNI